MNKVIIVGHPASGFLEVEAQLLRCGMKAPLPSRHEGVLPKELTEILCKAHQTPEADTLIDEDDFQQIEAGLVWHGLALDLLLGNLEQKLWGWADTQTIFLLDYWCSMDPQATFVLVYDEPQRVLIEASLRQHDALEELAIQHLLGNWAAYNGAMLRFALRHPDRCLLVNAQQVGRALDDYLTQLRARLSAPQEADDVLLSSNEALSSDKPEPNSALAESRSSHEPLAQVLHDALSIIGQSPGPALETLRADLAESYLVEHCLAAYPQYVQFYQELQSAANMPLVDAQSNPANSKLAWRSLVNQRELFTNILGGLYRQCHSFQTQNAQNEESCGLLLTQLNQVQEELESQQLEKQRVRLDLVEQLQQSQKEVIQLQERNTKHTQEHGLLVDQLEHVQEKFQSYYLENQRLIHQLSTHEEQSKKTITEQNQMIEKLTWEKQQLAIDTAARIKQQLSYRIGSTIVSRSRSLSGWLGMPNAIYREIKNFHRARQTR